MSGKDIPITCAPGESRLIKARTLLPGSIGTIVMIVEVNVDNIMVYGSTPVRMFKPQGSHVCNFSVTFDEMVGMVERSGVCGRQSVVPSATIICAQKHGKLTMFTYLQHQKIVQEFHRYYLQRQER